MFPFFPKPHCLFRAKRFLPIPPLDGSKILWGVLPPKLGFQYMQLERYGFLVLILLLMTGALGYVLYPLIQFSVNTVFSLIVLS